jgi:hypothetical protein
VIFARQNEASTSAFGHLGSTSFARKPGMLSLLIWYVPALALAAMFGAVVGLGGKTLPIFAGGAIGGLILLFAPLSFVFGVFLLLVFAVVGPLTSLANLQQALWAPYMIALALLVRVPMEWYHSSTVRQRHSNDPGQHMSPVLWAAVCYFTLLVVSAAVNRVPPMQALVGAKLYVFTWGAFFLLVVSSVPPLFLERLWKGLLFVAILQFPFALYQRLVEVPRRMVRTTELLALDAVVGTFPGTEGGGSSGALAVFLVFCLALAFSLWRNKILGNTATLLLVLACLGTLSLGETKVIIVLLPLAFLVLQRREVVRRPLRFLGIGILVAAILGVVFMTYLSAGNSERSGRQRTLSQYVDESFGYVFDPNNIDYRRGIVGRVAALSLWQRDQRQSPQTYLVGYGPGASQDSSVARGDVASRYLPLAVNSTTAAGLLWDVGAVGFAAFVALVFVALLQAIKLSNSLRIPPFHRCVLETCAVLFALVGATLAYSNDMLITPPLQALFFLALAHVVYWHSRQNPAASQDRNGGFGVESTRRDGRRVDAI